MTQLEKLYAERDASELDEAGNYYIKHVIAMTAEQLHSKSAIAAELAHRDMLIDKLTEELQAAKTLAVPRWIQVSERLPEYKDGLWSVPVIARSDTGDFFQVIILRRMAKNKSIYR